MDRRRYYSPLTNAILVVTTVWFVAGLALHLWWFEPMAAGLKAPDTRVFGYDLAAFQAWLDALSAVERQTFLTWHTGIVDLVFPWLLSLTMFLVISETLSQFPRFAHQRAPVRSIVPLMFVGPYLVFDLLENRSVSAIVRGAVPLDAANVNVAAAFTIGKFVFALLMFFVAGVFALTLRARHRKDAQ